MLVRIPAGTMRSQERVPNQHWGSPTAAHELKHHAGPILLEYHLPSTRHAAGQEGPMGEESKGGGGGGGGVIAC